MNKKRKNKKKKKYSDEVLIEMYELLRPHQWLSIIQLKLEEQLIKDELGFGSNTIYVDTEGNLNSIHPMNIVINDKNAKKD